MRLWVGLDIERQHGRTDGDIGRAQERIFEDVVESGVVRRRRGLTDDFAAAADAAVDQVADCETYVRFERRYTVAVQPITERGRILRYADVHPERAVASERSAGGLRLAGRTECPSQRGIAPSNVETRRLAAVAHQECAAVLQDAVEVDHGRTIVDAVARL